MVRTGHHGWCTSSSRSSLLDRLRWHAGRRWMSCWPTGERSPNCSSHRPLVGLVCVFLVLEAGGQLPGFFAYPAAFGDIAVGLTACVAVIALIWSTSTGIPIAWSVFGLLDFVGAVGTGFLASQAPAVVHTDPPTSPNGRWSCFRPTWCPFRSSCTSPRSACCWQTRGVLGMNTRPSAHRHDCGTSSQKHVSPGDRPGCADVRARGVFVRFCVGVR